MSARVRIRPPRAPYRRAGLVFASANDWIEYAEGELTEEQLIRLAGDPGIAMEGGLGDPVVWTAIPQEARDHARHLVETGELEPKVGDYEPLQVPSAEPASPAWAKTVADTAIRFHAALTDLANQSAGATTPLAPAATPAAKTPAEPAVATAPPAQPVEAAPAPAAPEPPKAPVKPKAAKPAAPKKGAVSTGQ